MTDFNNKLYKDNLDEGEYYVEHKDGSQSTLFLINDEHCKKSVRAKHLKILAPVPTFKEWQALKASYEMSNDANLKQATWMADMEKENAQLKELLKECVKMNTRLENALWQWNEESELYDENEALENKINEVLK